MKKIILLFLLMISSTSFSSNKNSGDLIKADDFNSSVFNIGDIKQSILTESQFQSINGDCWVSMTGQSIVGSDLAALTLMTNLPNASGRFLRTLGGDSAALGQTQDDALQGHKHALLADTNQGGGNATQLDTGANSAIPGRGSPETSRSHSVTGPVSDGINGEPRISTETRPKNLSVNTFIKINKQCNFN